MIRNEYVSLMPNELFGALAWYFITWVRDEIRGNSNGENNKNMNGNTNNNGFYILVGGLIAVATLLIN